MNSVMTGSSAGQKIPVQPGCCLPPYKIPLAENMFVLQAGKGAEKYKGKILAVLYEYLNA